MIREQGYADGALRGQAFAEIAPHLRAWAGNGVRVVTVTCGSI